MRIVSAGAVFPPDYYEQETLLAALSAHWAERHYNLERL